MTISAANRIARTHGGHGPPYMGAGRDSGRAVVSSPRTITRIGGRSGERAAHEYVFKFTSPFPDSVLPIAALRDMRLVCGKYSVPGEWDPVDEYAIGKPDVGEEVGQWQHDLSAVAAPGAWRPQTGRSSRRMNGHRHHRGHNSDPSCARWPAVGIPGSTACWSGSCLIVQRKIIVGLRRQEYRSLWAPLSARWLASPRKRNQLILVNYGDLSSSIEVVRRGPGDWEVGTNHVAARAHEFGYRPRRLPARPYFRPAFEDSIDEISELWKAQFTALINGWSLG